MRHQSHGQDKKSKPTAASDFHQCKQQSLNRRVQLAPGNPDRPLVVGQELIAQVVGQAEVKAEKAYEHIDDESNFAPRRHGGFDRVLTGDRKSESKASTPREIHQHYHF
jgi:hypothetical protein